MSKQMTNLITININEQQEPIISGRELHKVLGVGTEYAKWFSRMVEYGFIENQDFVEVIVKNDENSKGGRPSTDHVVKLDMAKEIAMIQRTEKGKEVRKYFIQVEKDFNSPEKIMARALKIAEKQISVLRLENQEHKNKIEADKPKVIFADAVSVSNTTILVGDLAKLLKQNGIEIGAKRFFERLREDGYLIKRKGADYNSPTQKSMELGLMQIKEGTHVHSDGHVSIIKAPKVTGKGQQYFINKFLAEKGKTNEE